MTYALSPENLTPLDPRDRSLRPVTKRQLAVLVYLRQHREVHHRSPSVRDTCEFFGFKSSAAPLGFFRALVAKGMLSPVYSRGGNCAGYELTPAGLAATDGQVLPSVPLTERRSARRRSKRASPGAPPTRLRPAF